MCYLIFPSLPFTTLPVSPPLLSTPSPPLTFSPLHFSFPLLNSYIANKALLLYTINLDLSLQLSGHIEICIHLDKSVKLYTALRIPQTLLMHLDVSLKFFAFGCITQILCIWMHHSKNIHQDISFKLYTSGFFTQIL